VYPGVRRHACVSDDDAVEGLGRAVKLWTVTVKGRRRKGGTYGDFCRAVTVSLLVESPREGELVEAIEIPTMVMEWVAIRRAARHQMTPLVVQLCPYRWRTGLGIPTPGWKSPGRVVLLAFACATV